MPQAHLGVVTPDVGPITAIALKLLLHVLLPAPAAWGSRLVSLRAGKTNLSPPCLGAKAQVKLCTHLEAPRLWNEFSARSLPGGSQQTPGWLMKQAFLSPQACVHVRGTGLSLKLGRLPNSKQVAECRASDRTGTAS